MKISEMIKNLQEFMTEHGDLDCWYAADDEGNWYRKVFYDPTLYYVDEDEEVFGSIEDLEEYDLTEEDVTKICVVN